jgi:chromosome segregation ATPase
MPRPASISYEEFRAAADELQSAGARLTYAAMRLKLGGGSNDVLKRYLHRYEKDADGRQAAPGVPETLIGGVNAWFEQAKAEARQAAYAELDKEFEAVEQLREQTAVEVAAIQERAAVAEALASERAGQVAALQARLEALQAALGEAQAERSRVEGLHQAAQTLAASLVSERDSAKFALERDVTELQHRHAAQLQEAHTRFDAAQHLCMRTLDTARRSFEKTTQTTIRQGLDQVSTLVQQTLTAVAVLSQREDLVQAQGALLERLAADVQKALQQRDDALASLGRLVAPGVVLDQERPRAAKSASKPATKRKGR